MDALKNLEVWQKSCRLSVDIYALLRGCTNRGFSDQLGRAGLSIASNIAEGYERESRKERAQFLKIAKGSCAETWTQLLVGIESGLLPREDALRCAGQAIRIRNMLFAFIRQIEESST